MDLTDREFLLAYLSRFRIRPDHGLGQNFLVSRQSLGAIVSAAGISKSDRVLEIGAGVGTLTRELAETGAAVTAVEFDRRLLSALRNTLEIFSNVRIVNEDFRRMDMSTLAERGEGNFKVVANIPYSLTGMVFRRLLELRQRPEMIVLLVQKEVAQRVCAVPGEMSLLALSVQLAGDPAIMRIVPRGDFFPPPEVDSAVLRIRIHTVSPSDEEREIMRLGRIGFSARRKMLAGNLAAGLRLPRTFVDSLLLQIGLKIGVRAQDLTPDHWRNLAVALRGSGIEKR